MKQVLITLILLGTLLNASDMYYYNYGVKESLSKLTALQRSHENIEYYYDEKANIVGVSNQVLVKLKDDKNLLKYLQYFNLSIIKEFSGFLYLLRTPNKSLSIDISNRLSEKYDVVYAQPDFIKKRERR